LNYRIPVASYTELTVWEISAYFKTSIICLFLHYLAVAAIKLKFVYGFKSRNNLAEKLFHVLTHLYCPSSYRDWDEDLMDLSDVKESWKRVKKEMKILLLLFALENVLLCIPMFILSWTIAERNLFLDQYFPQVTEESYSTFFVHTVSAILPFLFICLPFAQYLLFVMYNKFGHPWSKILRPELRVK
jgi:hypothetical protein